MSLEAFFWEAAKEVAKETAKEAAKEAAKEVLDKAAEAVSEAAKEAAYELPKRFGEAPAAEYLPERIGEEFNPQAQFEMDGITYETDDYGDIFKVDGQVRPNTEYTLDGVEYRSDAQGQTSKLDGAEPGMEGNGSETAGPKLSADEIAQKQAQVIESVENGDVPLETNKEKGNYGEMKVDQDLRDRGYDRISTDAVTDLTDPIHHGIDGVYHNPDGEPPYLIVDAKSFKAELNREIKGDGPQMSQSWIDARLDDAVGKETADEIRMAQLNDEVGCYVGRVAKGGDLAAEVIYDRVDAAGKIVEEGVRINGT